VPHFAHGLIVAKEVEDQTSRIPWARTKMSQPIAKSVFMHREAMGWAKIAWLFLIEPLLAG
jgi:hypothetical protein